MKVAYRTTSGGVVSTAESQATVKGPAVFEGVNATEVEYAGSGILFTTGASTSGKAYVTYANLVENTLGTTGTATVSGFNATFKAVYAPAQVTRFDLTAGQSYAQTFTINTTTTITGAPVPVPPTLTTTTSTITTTFVGIESVTVPAGTYSACKFTVQIDDKPLRSEWMAVGKGIVVRSASTDAQGVTTLTEMLSGTLNGSPI